MTLQYVPLTPDRVEDLDRLFSSDRHATKCWCVWYFIPVREYEVNGGEGNKAVFVERATADEFPMGVLALDGAEPVGWCATGPRSRFGRGIRTPTFQGRDPAEDDSVWLVPCFFTRPDRRGEGMSRGLLAAAVELAERSGATAVEGFPFAADGPHSSSEHQVNDEKVFTSAGFAVVRRPSRNRVVVRKELA